MEADTPLKPEKEKKKKEGPGKKELTIDRAFLAQERTLLAWVRTATTFLTFGFALFKFLEAQFAQTGHGPLLGFITPRIIGVTLLLTGLMGLILAMIRFYDSIKLLRKHSVQKFYSPAILQAYLVIALILLLLIGSMR